MRNKCTLRKDKFSEQEVKLFKSLDFTDMMLENVVPLEIWDAAAKEAFLYNSQGSNVEALRRGYKAVYYSAMDRNTEEFNKLIEFEETKN